MKYILCGLFLLLLFDCAEEKTIQLPEIEQSLITEVKDVSAAYLFYDDTQSDSVLLNRKNLISTTNWLVNVDKRLKLKQIIPHIKFLQNKKVTSSHKNKNAKNYYTCHDTSKNDLGFIDFTNTTYHLDMTSLFKRENSKTPNWEILVQTISLDSIRIHFAKDPSDDIANLSFSNQKNLVNDIKNIISKDSVFKSYSKEVTVFLSFFPELTFQDYITTKTELSKLKLNSASVSNKEFIYY